MPTVMLTTHCPNRCDWCFARTRMEDYLSRGIREMSWEDFLAVADFYERSRLHHMILVGGEPGLHTRFVDVLNVLGEKGFSTHVATTGILPERVVDGIAGETLPRLRFGVNSTSYFEYGRDKRWIIFFDVSGGRPIFATRSLRGIWTGRTWNRFWTGWP
jgi:MoaA/NifB/PqqE/SkfB family radical SAM enzyme